MDHKDTSWGSVQEAASRTGMTTMTIYRYINTGRLPAQRVGPRRIRVDLRAVDALFTDIVPTAVPAEA